MDSEKLMLLRRGIDGESNERKKPLLEALLNEAITSVQSLESRVKELESDRYEMTCKVRGEIGKVLCALNVAHNQLVGYSGLDAFVCRLQDKYKPEPSEVESNA